MEIIKKYPLGQLFGKPYESIDFAVLRSDELLKLISDEVNAGVHQFHMHDFYAIFWVEKGGILQKLDNKNYSLRRGDVFIACPGQVHENDFGHSRQKIVGGAILFTAKFINQLRVRDEISELTFLDNIFSNPHIHLSDSGLEKFLNIVSILYMEINRTFPNWAIVNSLSSALLLSVQEAIDDSIIKTTSNRHIEVYKQFRHFLEIHYKENKTPGFYADQLHISQRHLNRLLKETTSKTAADMIRARSVLEARRLLNFTDLKISEIAGILGYFDNSNFTKIFKKELGQTPQAYRMS
ncbi:MAG TPA: AraC family transcriptional regulator [Puia sp.]|jgi:AraC-like DNA-binding protein|nr:AraC family transcriptional regulator [Puia sp.]